MDWLQDLIAAPHGTTILALRCVDGVVMAADRRAVAGTAIALREAEKLFRVDDSSGIAFAGSPGPGQEIVRLFTTEIEHYEKVTGTPLTVGGKANRLSQMLADHLPAAVLGMAVVPIFCGYDRRNGAGRVFGYDITGGRYEEETYVATGSGSTIAGTVLKLGWTEDLDFPSATDLALAALFHAAEGDSFTGGPDVVRGIFPSLATISAEGFATVAVDEVSVRSSRLLRSLAATPPP